MATHPLLWAHCLPPHPPKAIQSRRLVQQTRAFRLRNPTSATRIKILTAQGSAARGGAYDYVIGSNMVGGVALIASPVSYGISGVVSFIVNYPETPSVTFVAPRPFNRAGPRLHSARAQWRSAPLNQLWQP
jgi:hypothetical protein